jgi:hypothetical protein
MGVLIVVIIIINVYTVWSNIEAQKEKLKEFRYQQNPNRALSELQSGRITISEYCDQLPAFQEKSQRMCSEYESSYGVK